MAPFNICMLNKCKLAKKNDFRHSMLERGIGDSSDQRKNEQALNSGLSSLT